MVDRMPKQWASRSEVLECQEAEFSCLGGVLLDNRAFDALEGLVRAEDFHDPRHATIWATMARIVGKNATVDPVTVSQALEESGELANVGGVEYVLGLAEAIATVVNIEHHGRIVADFAAKRRFIAKLEAHAEQLRTTPMDEQVKARDAVVADLLEDERAAPTRAVDVVIAGQAVYADLVDRHNNPRPFVGIPSGLADLDLLTLGFEDTDLITLAACSGHGKTLTGTFIGSQGALLSRRHTLYVSVEVPAERIARRLMAAECKVDAGRLRSGVLEAHDWVNLQEGVRRYAGLRHLMSVVYTPKGTVADIHREVRRYQLRNPMYPLGLVVVDYVQRLHPAERKRSREEEVADIARSLKDLAGMYRVPVIALAQLNRELFKRANKRPVVSDLRESSAMEHESSVIILQHLPFLWDEEKPKGVAELVIPKQRDGESGIVTVGISLAQQRLFNLERRQEAPRGGYDV